MSNKTAALIAMIMPYVNVAAGAIAAWLIVHVNVLSIFHLQQAKIAQAISALVVFTVTTVVGYVAAHYHVLPKLIGPSR